MWASISLRSAVMVVVDVDERMRRGSPCRKAGRALLRRLVMPRRSLCRQTHAVRPRRIP